MFGDWISKWVQAWGDGNGGMLGRGFRHELLLLRFLGKVPKCGETNSFAPVIVHPRVENCWDRQMQSAATIMSPSERQVVQRLSRSLFGSFADPRSSLTSRTKLGQHELGLKKTLVRFMATDHENSSIPQEGLSAKVGGNASEADDSSPVVQNLAAMTEDASAADANSSQVGDQVMPDKSHAEPGDPSATEVLQEKVDELTVEQTLILAENSGGVSHTTPEDLLSNLDDTDEGLKRLDTLAPALSKAMEEFQQGRGHPAKVYVHIKSFEKIRTGQLRNVRSAGLPVKRSLFTVNRSPHVDKKARDQFDMKVHKHLLIIETETHRLHQKLTELKNHDLPGVQLKVTFQYETRLDKSLLA